jgi:nitrogen fixation protein FixH
MNANTNINVLGGILDAMLANLTEHIDKRVEAKVFTLTERIMALEIDNAALQILLTNSKDGTPTVQPTDDVILRLDKLEERVGSIENCQDNDQMENSRRLNALEVRYSLSILDSEEFRHAVQQAQGASVTIDLDSEEFRLAVIKVIDQQVMEDTFLDPLVEAVTDSDKFNDKINEVAKEAADSAADEALDNHTSDYDHDDIHPVGEIDEDAVREVVDERLENVTISIKI